MDAYYYLMAQMPSLAKNSPAPITSKRFLELAQELLPATEYQFLRNVGLSPRALGTSTQKDGPKVAALTQAWWARESSLRLELAKLRSQNLAFGQEELQEIEQEEDVDTDIQAAARQAMGIPSPLEAENFLFEHRFNEIEHLKTSAPFSRNSASAYLLELLLLERQALFMEEPGFNEYKRIYSAIMNSSGAATDQGADMAEVGAQE